MSLIERLRLVELRADYPNGHVITGDNLALEDVAKAAAALERLLRYARHDFLCEAISLAPGTRCTCGLTDLTDLLKELDNAP